ncbi:MAG TPA: sialidase family protein [Gemmatimonadales bacterium]|nr:sialidase family protein [Gemmatimonadales bacterium]
MRTAALALVALALAACTPPPPPGGGGGAAGPPGVRVADMIPASLSGETEQDAEPFLAVHPSNPGLMAASAFTPNPGGPASGTAPIYVTEDSGRTWTLRMTVPSTVTTADITEAFDGGTGRLYAGILRVSESLLLNELVTHDVLSSTTMTVQASRGSADQPFVRATSAGDADRIYVGLNDFAVTTGGTATVDVSLDGGATYTSARIESRSTADQDGPSVRPAVARDQTVYAAYFGWRRFTGEAATSDVVVVRDDGGAGGATPFRDLVDPGDRLPGRIVARNVTIPWSNAPTLGQERIGSTLSIAVDPRHSEIVYLAWADRVGTGDIYTIHVRRSTDRGVTWSGDVRTLTNATNASLAVSDTGTVGLLYQQVRGTGPDSRWVTQLERSGDGFATHADLVLATVPANTPAPQFLPYIGDYNFLTAVGPEFRGVFSANNTPDSSDFPQGVVYQRKADFQAKRLVDGAGGTVRVSIDPFYFSVPVRP